LFCGDARDNAASKTVLDGCKAAFVFTDPPYNVPIDGHVAAILDVEADGSGESGSTVPEDFAGVLQRRGLVLIIECYPR